jgi:hypothetical protein
MERLAQCQCGSLRAIASGEPLLVNMCHCKACQRRTGALASNGAAFAKAPSRSKAPEKSSSGVGNLAGQFASIFAPTVERRCIGSLMSDRTCTSWRSAHSEIRAFPHRRVNIRRNEAHVD